MLGVSGNYPRFTFRGPRASAFASVHPATVLVSNGRILAGCTFTRFGEAALAGPLKPFSKVVKTENQYERAVQ